MEKKIRTGQSEDILQAQTEKDILRCRGRVIRAERRYPGIHRRILTEKYLAHIASDIGITRERVRQLQEQFNELIAFTGRTPGDTVDEIEEMAKSD